MDLQSKEKSIKDLLDEMKCEKLRQNGFSDLYIMGYIENKYQENFDRYGTDYLGFKTIITEKRDRTSLSIFENRLNNVCLEKTFVKDGIMNIFYDNVKEIRINIKSINRIYAMKKGDNHVY